MTREVVGGGEGEKKKKPTVDILPVALHSIPRCESSVTVGVVYLSKSPRSICTLGEAAIDASWRFGSAPSAGGGLIPIRGLTFSAHSSDGVIPGGQESRAIGLLPPGTGRELRGEKKGEGKRRIEAVEPRSDKAGLKMSEQNRPGCGKFGFTAFVVLSCADVIFSDLSPHNQIPVACHTQPLRRKTRWRGR